MGGMAGGGLFGGGGGMAGAASSPVLAGGGLGGDILSGGGGVTLGGAAGGAASQAPNASVTLGPNEGPVTNPALGPNGGTGWMQSGQSTPGQPAEPMGDVTIEMNDPGKIMGEMLQQEDSPLSPHVADFEKSFEMQGIHPRQRAPMLGMSQFETGTTPHQGAAIDLWGGTGDKMQGPLQTNTNYFAPAKTNEQYVDQASRFFSPEGRTPSAKGQFDVNEFWDATKGAEFGSDWRDAYKAGGFTGTDYHPLHSSVPDSALNQRLNPEQMDYLTRMGTALDNPEIMDSQTIGELLAEPWYGM